MKKKEMIEKLNTCNDDSDMVFVKDRNDLLQLDDEGIDINEVAEINNGRQTVIALLE